MITSLTRAAAWTLLIVIIALSVVPASQRPVTGTPQGLEHFAIFMMSGLTFGLGYRSSPIYQAIGLVAFAAAIELAQYLVPGRHARLSDFVLDSIAVCLGIAAAWVITRSADRWNRMRGETGSRAGARKGR